jgi:quinoprotein glucose dehydrogenase
MKKFVYLNFICLNILLIACNNKDKGQGKWEVYGGGKENTRYSGLTEIDTNNVKTLTKAWEFHTGDTGQNTQMQFNSIVVNDLLYAISPKLKLIALNAATGIQNWVFDPFDLNNNDYKGAGYFAMNVCRGVTYYADAASKRLFYGAGSNLYCIDAITGKPIQNFGNAGKIDLHNDLGRELQDLYIAMTSPGIIYKDLIILSTRVDEGAAAAPGYIRAYDVHTGKLRWIFHTIPQPGELGYESWDDKEAWKHIGGANAWAGFSMDEAKGIVYAPIGSASYDFYGGKRLGDNLFANSILALDAATGKRIWHYQTVHHDVWDRDLPTAPALVTITKDGKRIEAIAQPTKSGFVFLLDRLTGKPIYPIEEKPVPHVSELVGEKLSSTQPWPSFIEPFARQSLTEKDLNQFIPASSYADIKARLDKVNTGFIFNPTSKKGTVIFPGFDGGAEWGGPAYDTTTGLLYVNANEMPWILTMIDNKNEAPKKQTNEMAGKSIYMNNCAACHGLEKKGSGNYPSLIGTDKKYTSASFSELMAAGRRMMPSFKRLKKEEVEALSTYVLDLKEKQKLTYVAPVHIEDPYWKMAYTSTGYNKFLTKEGYPAVTPPWGTLNAINLNTGKIVWKDTLGDYPELLAKGIHSGTENYGGPVVTAGGLLFIAATKDGKFRAFNKYNGKLLWETTLPAPGFATPTVYNYKGKQYIVIACGGGKLGTASGDAYVAYALP